MMLARISHACDRCIVDGNRIFRIPGAQLRDVATINESDLHDIPRN
jgi:hypothetical protein